MGIVTILGARLSQPEKTYWVHAPHYIAIPVLRCHRDSVVEIRSHPSAKNLRRLSSLHPIFRNIWGEGTGKDSGTLDQTFRIIETSRDLPPRAFLQELSSPPQWNQRLEELEFASNARPIRVFVCGPKSSGKSTFCKLLLNYIITAAEGRSLAVLDIDPGQPEYTPAGLISLVHVKNPNLGPSFTHPIPAPEGNIIVRSHATAAPSPEKDPSHYKACVLELLARYKTELSHLPLITNTPGWIQGTGLELLAGLIRILVPDAVIYMSIEGPEETVDVLQAAVDTSVTKFCQLPSQPSQYTPRTSEHLRTMMTMSYFHSKPSSSQKNSSKESVMVAPTTDWDPTVLIERLPRMLSYSEKGGITGVVCYHAQPHPAMLAGAILANTVAIVELESPLPVKSLVHTPEGIPYMCADEPLDPVSSNVLGLGLLKTIDEEKKIMGLCTPIAAQRIEATIDNGKFLILVAGKFEYGWALCEGLYDKAGSRAENSDKDLAEVTTNKSTGEDCLEDAEAWFQSVSDHKVKTPWVKAVKSDQKKGVGDKVWRVRNDLGRRSR